jgi:hypothetical protein
MKLLIQGLGMQNVLTEKRSNQVLILNLRSLIPSDSVLADEDLSRDKRTADHQEVNGFRASGEDIFRPPIRSIDTDY